MTTNDFMWLQEWFVEHCKEGNEHEKMIEINTLDNPGWIILIRLLGTELEGKEFIEVTKDLSEDDWFSCFLREGQFYGAGGLRNLPEILQIFRRWATN